MHYGDLALAAHRENRVEDALKYYHEYLKEQPLSSEGWYALGLLHHTKTGDTRSAIEYYEKSLELAPTNPLAELHLGTLLSELDRPEDAARHLEKHVTLNPTTNSTVYAELACAYARLGQTQKAQDIAHLCCEQHPNEAFPPFLAAWVEAKLGNLSAALSYITDSVALDPAWPIPLGMKGLLLTKLGQTEYARRVLQEMVIIHSNAIASGVASETLKETNQMWCNLRNDAKQKLGIRHDELVNFILLYGGLGDQFINATMLAPFKSHTNTLPLVVLCNTNARWETLFPNSADLFLHVEVEIIRKLGACNRFFPDHPYTNFFPWFGPLVSIDSGQEGTKFFLGLPNDAQGTEPIIPSSVRQDARKLFFNLGGQQGRSVLISPLSNSNPMNDNVWWQDLVDELLRSGCVVFQNMTNIWNADRPENLRSAIPVELPLEQVIPFCEEAGYFVGIRSGLCDLLGYAKCCMIAVHVNRRYPINLRYPLSVWLDSTSGHGLRKKFQNECWQDIYIDQDSEFDPCILEGWRDWTKSKASVALLSAISV